MDLPAPLTREVGPLPVWAWLAAGLLGIGLGVALRRRSSTSTSTSSSTGSGPAGVDGAAVYPIGSVGGAVTLPNYAPAETATEAPGIESNHEWRARALKLLIARGFDPFTADQALAGYLDGRPPTAETAEAIDIALSEVGLPPSAPTIVPSATPAAPAETPSTEDAAVDIYAGDRLAQIVREAYRDILGREPDPEGLQFWRGRLASGELSPSEFRRHFAAAAGKEFDSIR